MAHKPQKVEFTTQQNNRWYKWYNKMPRSAFRNRMCSWSAFRNRMCSWSAFRNRMCSWSAFRNRMCSFNL